MISLSILILNHILGARIREGQVVHMSNVHFHVCEQWKGLNQYCGEVTIQIISFVPIVSRFGI